MQTLLLMQNHHSQLLYTGMSKLILVQTNSMCGIHVVPFCHLYSQAIDQQADPLVFSTSQLAGEYAEFVKQVCDLVAYAQVASTLLSAEQTAVTDEVFRRVDVLRDYQQRLSTIASNSCEWVSECSQSGSTNKHVITCMQQLLADAKPSQSATLYWNVMSYCNGSSQSSQAKASPDVTVQAGSAFADNPCSPESMYRQCFSMRILSPSGTAIYDTLTTATKIVSH